VKGEAIIRDPLDERFGIYVRLMFKHAAALRLCELGT